jgi:ribosome-associated protein
VLKKNTVRRKKVRYEEDYILTLNVDTVNTVIQPATNQSAEETTSEMLLARILISLENDKAEDIVQIDLRGKSSIGDYMIIASGRSSRQVSAISEKLVDNIKQDFGRSSKVEGKGAGDWVLIDAGDIIVHVFRPEVRDFYQLEKMWQSLKE